MRKLFIAAVIVICIAYPVYGETANFGDLDSDYTGKVVIVCTNDVHGEIGKYQYVAGLRKELMARGTDVLLVDSGDYLQGNVNVSWDKGVSAVSMMNAAGYDLAALGNHEFDYGAEKLKSDLDGAVFKVVCNSIYDANGNLFLGPSTGTCVHTVGGIKIGLFGVATPSTKVKSAPSNTAGLTFLDDMSEPTMYDQTANDIQSLRSKGADIVIGLTHLGVDEADAPYRSYDLWSELKKKDDANVLPDLILDSHSHTEMTEGLDGEPIMSTKTKLENVGIVVIDESTAKIEDRFLYKVEDIKENGLTDDTVKELAESIEKKVDEEYGKTIGTSAVELNGTRDQNDAKQKEKAFENGNRDGETNFGDYFTDAFRQVALTEIESGHLADIDADHVVSMQNGGGIRACLLPGDVSMKSLMSAVPFSNAVYGVYVKGSDLLETLEACTQYLPEPSASFPQVSGIQFTIDTRYEYYPRTEPYPGSAVYGPKEIRRVKIQNVNGKPFGKSDTYLVMVTDFLAEGGDSYYCIGKAEKKFDTGIIDVDALAGYLTGELGRTIDEKYADPAGRIKIVTGAAKKTANTMTVKKSNKKVSYKKLKKKSLKVKPLKVSKAVGKVTYKKAGGSGRLTVNKTTGKVTVKRQTKKGTYKVRIKVTAKGDRYYNSKSKTVTVKVRVK